MSPRPPPSRCLNPFYNTHKQTPISTWIPSVTEAQTYQGDHCFSLEIRITNAIPNLSRHGVQYWKKSSDSRMN